MMNITENGSQPGIGPDFLFALLSHTDIRPRALFNDLLMFKIIEPDRPVLEPTTIKTTDEVSHSCITRVRYGNTTLEIHVETRLLLI